MEKWDDINNNHLESFTEIVTLHNDTAVDAGCQAGKRESVSRRRTIPTPEISISKAMESCLPLA